MDNTNEGSKRIATIGGTFDALHHGHKEYIRLALEFSDFTIIYLSTNEYLNGKIVGRKGYQVRPYEERYNRLAEFVEELGCKYKYEIRPHSKEDDFVVAYLNEFTRRDVRYIAIVSPDYYQKFLAINQMRENNGLSSILLVVKPRFRDGKNELSSGSARIYLEPASFRGSCVTYLHNMKLKTN